MRRPSMKSNIFEKKNKFLTTLLVLLLGIVLQACSSPTELTVGDQAPEFNLPSSEGQQVSLSEYTGNQPVLLFFHMAVG
jgi:hypothetical protein